MKLYELVTTDGASISPYVWRIKYALARKGIDDESIPLGFVDIQRVLGGRSRTVPVLEDAQGLNVDSWPLPTISTKPIRPAPCSRPLRCGR